MRALIVLRSGAQVEVDIDELETTRNRFTNQLTELEWTTPADWTAKLHTVALSEIAAIVIRREDVPFPGASQPEQAQVGTDGS